MRNRVRILFLIVLVIVSFSGCTYGNYNTTASFEISTFTSMSMSYMKFDGYKTTEIHVNKGEPVEVSIAVVSEEGKLGLTITGPEKGKGDSKDSSNEKEETIYKKTEVPTSDFKVTLDKPGKYKITVTGKDHKGSYKVKWNIVDKKGE